MFGLFKDVVDVVVKPVEIIAGNTVKPLADLVREAAEELSPYEDKR